MRVFVRVAIEDPGYEVANEGLYELIIARYPPDGDFLAKDLIHY